MLMKMFAIKSKVPFLCNIQLHTHTHHQSTIQYFPMIGDVFTGRPESKRNKTEKFIPAQFDSFSIIPTKFTKFNNKNRHSVEE